MKILTRTFIWWVNLIYCSCYYNFNYLNIPLNLQNFNLNKHRSYRNLAAAELIAKQQQHFMKCLPKDQARFLVNDFASKENLVKYDWHTGFHLPSMEEAVNLDDKKLLIYLTKNLRSRWRWEVIMEPDFLTEDVEDLVIIDGEHSSSNEMDIYTKIEKRTKPLTNNLQSNFIVVFIDEKENLLCANPADEFHLMAVPLKEIRSYPIENKTSKLNFNREKYCYFKVHDYGNNYFSLELDQLNSRKTGEKPNQSHFLAVDFARIFMQQMNREKAVLEKNLMWRWDDLNVHDLVRWRDLKNGPCQGDRFLDSFPVTVFAKGNERQVRHSSHVMQNDPPHPQIPVNLIDFRLVHTKLKSADEKRPNKRSRRKKKRKNKKSRKKTKSHSRPKRPKCGGGRKARIRCQAARMEERLLRKIERERRKLRNQEKQRKRLSVEKPAYSQSDSYAIFTNSRLESVYHGPDDEFVGPTFIENQDDKSRKDSSRRSVHRKNVRNPDQSDTSHLDAAK